MPLQSFLDSISSSEEESEDGTVAAADDADFEDDSTEVRYPMVFDFVLVVGRRNFRFDHLVVARSAQERILLPPVVDIDAGIPYYG